MNGWNGYTSDLIINSCSTIGDEPRYHKKYLNINFYLDKNKNKKVFVGIKKNVFHNIVLESSSLYNLYHTNMWGYEMCKRAKLICYTFLICNP